VGGSVGGSIGGSIGSVGLVVGRLVVGGLWPAVVGCGQAFGGTRLSRAEALVGPGP